MENINAEMLTFVSKVFSAAYDFQNTKCGDITLGEAYVLFSNLQSIRRATAKLEKSVNTILDRKNENWAEAK